MRVRDTEVNERATAPSDGAAAPNGAGPVASIAFFVPLAVLVHPVGVGTAGPTGAVGHAGIGVVEPAILDGVPNDPVLAVVGSFVVGVVVALLFLHVRNRDDGEASFRWGSSRNGSSPTQDGSTRPLRVPSNVEVLTDRERVVQLLYRNDSAMRQSQLVEETEWSKAKVSRLLSRMEARGEVTRVADGRENIVYLGSNVDGRPDETRRAPDGR